MNTNTILTRTLTMTRTIMAILAFSTFAVAGMASASDPGAIDPRCQSAITYPVLIGSGYECVESSLPSRNAATISTEAPAVSSSASSNATLQETVLDGSGYEGQTTPAPVVLHGARAR